MKINISKQVYDQLSPTDQAQIEKSPCICRADGSADAEPDCIFCDGLGVMYEDTLTAEETAQVQENFRKQGVPLGKIGTH